MPELNWEGKADAVKLAKNIPVHLLKFDSASSCDSENLIVQGDNLQVMKALLPRYKNRVRCIYIDPPYNTGAVFEHYNDNFEHATWLNFMYPRLEMLREFLSDDGAIFISIDDNEQAHLKLICDEIFGAKNFVAECAVKRSGGRQDSKFFAVVNEYLICYAKNANFFTAGEEVKLNDAYPKFDAECGRNYKTQLLRKWGSNSRRADRPNLFYSIPAPDGSELYPMLSKNEDGCWRWGKNKMQSALDDGLIEFVKRAGEWIAYEKIYQPLDGEARTKKFTTWIDDSFNGADTLKKILGANVFDYPKAVELIERILKMGNVDKDSIVLDAFAGSGTTAHAVINLNGSDGGERKFILIEEKEYCKTITAERVKRIGGSFKFAKLGEKLLTEYGAINPDVTPQDLAAHIWFKETGSALTEKISLPLIGIHDGAAIYLLDGMLTKETLPTFDGQKIIFGRACRLSESFLRTNKIIFRHLPTAI